MKKIEQLLPDKNESTATPENEKEKYLQFGKYTRDCPEWLLDKVSTIDNSKIDEAYVEKILEIIASEFNPNRYQITRTNDIKVSRFINVKNVLDKRLSSCGSKATVVASVLRSLNIPTKLVHGLYIDRNPRMRHAWNEVCLNEGYWVPFDITHDYKGFKLDKFNIKKFEAVDWEEYEDHVDKF
jgi:hypothetical protein